MTSIESNSQARLPTHHHTSFTSVAPQWTPLRVFLVEDSAIIREHVIEGIACGGRVKIVGYADTEQGAIEKLHEIECDVVILDLGLAEGTGAQVLKAIRHDLPYQPQVVVFTNYTHPNTRRQIVKQGADFFLSKSTDFDRLKEIVRAISTPEGTGSPH